MAAVCVDGSYILVNSLSSVSLLNSFKLSGQVPSFSGGFSGFHLLRTSVHLLFSIFLPLLKKHLRSEPIKFLPVKQCKELTRSPCKRKRRIWHKC